MIWTIMWPRRLVTGGRGWPSYCTRMSAKMVYSVMAGRAGGGEGGGGLLVVISYDSW